MVDDPRVLIELDGLTVAYGDRVVLDDMSATLHAGESLSLIGPNGAGKTTLIQALLGLVRPHSGTVEVLGTAPAHCRSKIAYVPQADLLDAMFPVTAAEVVLMGRYRRIGWLRRPGSRDRSITGSALERVGMAHRSGDRFGTLSGGQRQRVLLARAIAQEADVLLLDEPFNGVDTTTVDVVLEVLEELRSRGAGVVMSTHDLSVAKAASTHAMLLNRAVYAFGLVDDVVNSENLNAAYGGAIEGHGSVSH